MGKGGYMNNQSKKGSGRNNNPRNGEIKKQGSQSYTRLEKNGRETDRKDHKNNQNMSQKKVGINARNEKAKYSDDEIERARYIDSKAKFLVRDRIHNDNIDTRNKWIGISNIKSKDRWDSDGNYDPEILSFDAEIFDRTEQPVYEEYMSEDEKHKLTYEVAEGDIQKQKNTEKRLHKSVDRPSYHVDVATKYTKDKKTEYQVKNIQKKK